MTGIKIKNGSPGWVLGWSVVQHTKRLQVSSLVGAHSAGNQLFLSLPSSLKSMNIPSGEN